MGSDYFGTSADTWVTNIDVSPSNQVNWLATVGNTFYITGVQIEEGDTATEFEHRSFAEELQLCQRYYQQITHDADNVIRGGYGLTSEYWQVQLPVQMRAAPSSSLKSGTVAYSNCSSFTYYTSANTVTNNTVTAFLDPNDNTYFYVYPTSAANLVWQFMAEL